MATALPRLVARRPRNDRCLHGGPGKSNMHQSKEAQDWLDVDRGAAATLGKVRATVEDISANLADVES